MEEITQAIGQALTRELKARSDIQTELLQILKLLALKLDDLEKRFKAIETIKGRYEK